MASVPRALTRRWPPQLALAHKRSGDYAEAVDSFINAIAANPRNPTAHFNLAVVFHELGRTDEAIESLEEAIKLRPRDHVALSTLSLIQEQRGAKHAAAKAALRALRANPNSKGAHRALGRLYAHISRFETAHEYLQEALTVERAQENAAFDLAHLRESFTLDLEGERRPRYARVLDRGNLKLVEGRRRGSRDIDTGEELGDEDDESNDFGATSDEDDLYSFRGGFDTARRETEKNPLVLLAAMEKNSRVFEVDGQEKFWSTDDLYRLAQDVSVAKINAMRGGLTRGARMGADERGIPLSDRESCNYTIVRDVMDDTADLPGDWVFRTKPLVGKPNSQGRSYGFSSKALGVRTLNPEEDLAPGRLPFIPQHRAVGSAVQDMEAFDAPLYHEQFIYRLEMQGAHITGVEPNLLLRGCALFLSSAGVRTPLKVGDRFFDERRTPEGRSVTSQVLQTAASVMVPDSGTFSGWVGQVMTRIVLLRGALKADEHISLIVPGERARLANESLELLGFKAVRHGQAKGKVENKNGAVMTPLWVTLQTPEEEVSVDNLVTVDWRPTDDRPLAHRLPPRDALQRLRTALSSRDVPLTFAERPLIVFVSRNQKLADVFDDSTPIGEGGSVSLTAQDGEILRVREAARRLGRRRGGIANEEEVLTKLRSLVGNAADVVVYAGLAYGSAAAANASDAGYEALKPQPPFEETNLTAILADESMKGPYLQYLQDFQKWKNAYARGGGFETQVEADAHAGPGTLRHARHLFSRARVVVGVHGDDLANIVFCAPGTALVELTFREPVYRQYAHMATALDMPYYAYTDLPPNAAARRRLRVDADKLARLVDKAITDGRDEYQRQYAEAKAKEERLAKLAAEVHGSEL